MIIDQKSLLSRRTILASVGAVGAAAILPFKASAFGQEIDTSGLSSLTTAIKPIGRAERAARIERAQALRRSMASAPSWWSPAPA